MGIGEADIIFIDGRFKNLLLHVLLIKLILAISIHDYLSKVRENPKSGIVKATGL